MTDQAFDALLRKALMDAVMEDLGPVWDGELPADPQSPRQRRRMLRLLRDPFRIVRRRARPAWKRGLRAAVCAVLISAALFAATIAAVPQARAWVKELWSQWFETNTRYQFSGELPPTAEVWRFSYLPENYLESFSNDDDGRGQLEFTNEIGNRIYFEYMVTVDGSWFSVDNEHSTFNQIYLSNGTVAELYTSNFDGWPSFLLWLTPDESTAFLLEADIDTKQLIKMAESVGTAKNNIF